MALCPDHGHGISHGFRLELPWPRHKLHCENTSQVRHIKLNGTGGMREEDVNAFEGAREGTSA